MTTAPDPEPPENVKLKLANRADALPVDCSYRGYDAEEGVHLWVVILPKSLQRSDITGIEIKTLPACTSVAIEVEAADA